MPIILVGSSGTATDPTPNSLQQIRQYTAVEMGGEGIGGFLSSVASSGSLNQLIDNSWPTNTTLDVAEQWQDAWLLRPNAFLAADKLRIINSYTPNGGIIVPDLAWANAPIANEPYEIHTVLEPVTALNKCINYGLKRCMVETEFSFIPIGGANWHSMALVAPWLTNKSWVREVGWISAGEERNRVWPYERVVRGEAIAENGTVILSHPNQIFGSQGQISPYTIYVRAMIPAFYACMVPSFNYGIATTIATTGTTWTITVNSTVGMVVGKQVTLAGFVPTAYNGTFIITSIPTATTFEIQTYLQPGVLTTFGTITSTQTKNGLALDSDLTPTRTEWAGWATVVEAWRHYGQALDTQSQARLMPNRKEAADMFTKWTRDQGKWPKQTFRPLIAAGPLRIGFGGLPVAYRATTA